MVISELIDKLALTHLFDDAPSPPQPDAPTPDPTDWEAIGDEEWGDTTDYMSTWSESTPFEAGDSDDELPPIRKIQTGVASTWRKRAYTTRYEKVIVLLISWEEHDLGDSIKETARQYTLMFESLYNYEVWVIKIPSKKPHLALTSHLVELAKQDSPESLFVIWYDGHGLEHMDRRGPPRWCSHEDNEKTQTVDSGIISTTLSDCEADILLINNACNSLTCDRFNGNGVVESISASAFNTSTYGALNGNDLSPSMTWAAHKILSDERCVEEGITVPELHRRICLATQWAGSNKYPQYDEHHELEDIDWRTSYIRTQPVYTRLSADTPGPGGRTRGIVLRKLAKKGYPGGSSNPKEWTEWILSAPSGAYFPTIELVEEERVT
ncbi:hypothetical protein E0Z10_g5246 [Xylaria hypoxylon]|uniref:Caspase family p20 domain-containing protein n=1 Tax=Xylaria hypoxylon TaxID=37992 RepID=A0A4Z0YUB4_9PEZI|nr:hypothetical protein E0Z10_g5246 [Xylaria hypoxylon]